MFIIYQTPPELGRLTKLKRLGLGDNRLFRNIPLELGGLTELIVLSLAGNDWTGRIPGGLLDVYIFIDAYDINLPVCDG